MVRLPIHKRARKETEMSERTAAINDEAEIHALIERWAKAVRDEDLPAIRADHDPQMLMFDVPPPFIIALRTRRLYGDLEDLFDLQIRPVQYGIHDMTITTGKYIAFATAIGRCCNLSSGEKSDVDFRLPSVCVRSMDACASRASLDLRHVID